MKKLIAAVVVLGLGAAGVWAYLTYAVVKVEPQILEATITRGDITEVVQATGTLEALRTVTVGSQVSGTVSDILADYNTIVKKDMIIAKIDPSLLQVQVEIQKANIAKQETDIASQQIQLEDAQRTLARTKELFANKLATQQAAEQADLAVRTRAASIESAKKSLFQTQKSLEQAELNVSYCTIKSPIDGVIVQRIADVGQTVQASMTSPQFFVVATDLTTLRLTGGVDEADIGKIRPGQTVTFTVTAYNKTFRGVVDRVRLNAQNQNSVVTYQVVANVDNPNLELRPSMTATLKIVIETAPNVVKIPNSALRFKPTKDMYEALGATPPTPGQRPGGPGMNGQNGAPGGPGGPGMTPGSAPAGAPASGAPAAGAAASGASAAAQTTPPAADPNAQNPQSGRTGGRGGSNRNNRNAGGTGFGGQNSSATLTPQELAILQQQYGSRTGGRGGAGGAGGSGRGGRNGQPANAVTGPVVPLTERGKDKVDDLFAALDRPNAMGSVWTWDPAGKQLKAVTVRTGISDGAFTELVAGDLQPNVSKVLTGIIVPVVVKPGANPLMGNQPGRGNPGGMQPGTPGGGGGGRGGAGGGGGGRGGN
jgi:HlyD family secretion protein